MTKKQFMVDIESTGVDFKEDEILEIGIVEMQWVEGFWWPGKEFHTFVHSTRKPESEFAKKHMVEVYRKANETPPVSNASIGDKIREYFKFCGKEGEEVFFCGWNASSFDVPFLAAHGFLGAPGYETIDGKDQFVGDYHYRIYEIGGAIELVCDATDMGRDEVKAAANEAFSMHLPAGKDHDAIYDCHKQIKFLNGLISLTRNPRTIKMKYDL